MRKVRGAPGLGTEEGASDAVVLAVIGWGQCRDGRNDVVFIMRLLQKRQQAEVGGSVVRAVGLMQGNTERDGCGSSNAVSRTTARPEEEGGWWLCSEV